MGFQCVDCIAEAAARHAVERSSVGGVARGGPPKATYTIIAVCAVAYVFQLAARSFTIDLQFAPILGPSQPWRMLSAAFLHDPNQPMHILFNMLALWQVGSWLEPFLGRARFVVLYLASALGGSVGYLLLSSPPQNMMESYSSSWLTPTVGASGAVFGLFGALLVFLRHLGRSAGGLIALLLVNALLPLFYPSIAWQAHLGGFVTGIVLAAGIVACREPHRRRLQWPILAGFVVLLIVLAVAKYAIVDDALVKSLIGL